MSVCINVCVHVYVCHVHVSGGITHMCASVWRAEVNIGLLLQLFYALFLKTNLSWNQELIDLANSDD